MADESKEEGKPELTLYVVTMTAMQSRDEKGHSTSLGSSFITEKDPLMAAAQYLNASYNAEILAKRAEELTLNVREVKIPNFRIRLEPLEKKVSTKK